MRVKNAKEKNMIETLKKPWKKNAKETLKKSKLNNRKSKKLAKRRLTNRKRHID
jgi:hypothetical protein